LASCNTSICGTLLYPIIDYICGSVDKKSQNLGFEIENLCKKISQAGIKRVYPFKVWAKSCAIKSGNDNK